MTQKFTYYLHDNYATDERREVLEDQGISLSEEAWENLGRPFYEIALDCEVEDDGFVRILGAKST